MTTPEQMTLQTADHREDYSAMVYVTDYAVIFNMGFTFQLDRESVRQVCTRLLKLLNETMP